MYSYGSELGSYEVTCTCSHEFFCLEEPHSPLDCDTRNKWMSIDYVKKFILKMGDNVKSEKWKLMNTKPCPKCKSRIYKDRDCSHMTCLFPCCFQFYWFCLEVWKNVVAHYDTPESNHNAHYDCVEYDESGDDKVDRERNGEYYYEH